MKKWISIAVVAVFAAGFALTGTRTLIGTSRAMQTSEPHGKYFENYEGTKTCLECHEDEAKDFFHSQHYQWKGDAPNIVNSDGRKLGKMNTFNDFCTSPQGNWIGLVRNSRGEVISKGCSSCHAGLGKMPSEVMSREQLENIDCLICHARGYNRDLVETGEDQFEWRPILWKNKEGLNSVAKRISRPTRVMCLRCHSASGGGPNYKRGDLEYTLADPGRDYDVHMATEGKNMQCTSCHKGRDHRVPGRGTDLSATDLKDVPLSCSTSECHASPPHKNKILNTHAETVNCTVCHIPKFARDEPTDMFRDWSTPAYVKDKDKYAATIRLEQNVTPSYAWFNGYTRSLLPGQVPFRLPDGSAGIMLPQGSRDDPKAKIFAFKVHKGRLPMLEDKGWIVPITVEHFFANGEIDPAVKSAAKTLYGLSDIKYTWTDTTRYMGIFHGVQPKEKALKCMDCHGKDSRMDWISLGYKGNPMTVKPPPRGR